jgi:hypothetical protein
MRIRARFTLRAQLLALLLFACPACLGATSSLEELVAAGHLDIETKLTPAASTVPGQKLTLTLKISTDRWFSGGTRIKLPEVPGLVILQTEQFASNASERRGDQSWVIQRWTLDVFPQRTGEFTLPPISASVNVNTRDSGDVEGALDSSPLRFTVTLPKGLADVEHWVAAPEFTAIQRFDHSLENLQVGDAFEREIVFEASDVMAMMLPSLTPEELPGLAAYPSPPVLDNSSNRGETRASRSQRISYVAQADGQYQLPARDFFWWDTQRGKLQVVTLPATLITVGAGAVGESGENPTTMRISPRQLLLGAGAIVLLALVLWLARKLLAKVPLGPLVTAIGAGWKKLQDLRKPALPERLNPGSSAGKQRASESQ